MIERSDIEKLATLARIKMTEEEAEALRADIDPILGYVSELSSIETPVADTPAQDELPVVNVLRSDDSPHESGVFTEALLAQAPGREGNYLKVKKIL